MRRFDCTLGGHQVGVDTGLEVLLETGRSSRSQRAGRQLELALLDPLDDGVDVGAALLVGVPLHALHLVAAVRLFLQHDERHLLRRQVLDRRFADLLQFAVALLPDDLEVGAGRQHAALGQFLEDGLGRFYGGRGGWRDRGLNGAADSRHDGRETVRCVYHLELLAVRQDQVSGGHISDVFVAGLSQRELQLLQQQVPLGL